MKEMQKLMMYESGEVRTAVDYVLARKNDERCEGDSRRGVCFVTQAGCDGHEY